MFSLLLIYAVSIDALKDTSNSISNINSVQNLLDIVVFERVSVELTGQGQIICDKTKIGILGLNYDKIKSKSQTTKCKSITDLTHYATDLELKTPNHSQIRKDLEGKLKDKHREYKSLEQLISDKDMEYVQLEQTLKNTNLELQKAKDKLIDVFSLV